MRTWHPSLWLLPFLLNLLSLGTTAGEEPLAPYTEELISRLAQKPGDRISIRAFVSPLAPAADAPTIKLLREVLSRVAELGAPRIEVEVLDAEPYSTEARRAYLDYGIKPAVIDAGEPGVLPGVYLFSNVVVSSGNRVERLELRGGATVELQLVLAITKVAGVPHDRRLGLVESPLLTLGGGTAKPAVLSVLEQHFDVVLVDPSKGLDDVDVLLVPQLSALDQAARDKVIKWIRDGMPVLLLEDPLPMGFRSPNISFLQPKAPKPDLEPLWQVLGVRIAPDRVVWQSRRPGEVTADLPSSIVFLENRPDSPAMSRQHSATASLRAVVAMAPGAIEPTSKTTRWTPLLSTVGPSGFMSLEEARGNAGGKTPTEVQHVIAAHVRGPDGGLNVILLADLDLASNAVIGLANQTTEAIPVALDNQALLLNAIDMLVDDTEMHALRSRRAPLAKPSPEQRRIIQEIQTIRERLAAEEQKLRKEAEDELKRALGEQPERIRGASDADRRARLQVLQVMQQQRQRRLEIQLDKLRRDFQRRLAAAQAQLTGNRPVVSTK